MTALRRGPRSPRWRSGRQVFAGLGLVVALGLAGPAPAGVAAAAAPATFGTPTATATFGDGVVFRQPVTLDGAPRRIELLIDEPGSIGPLVVEVPTPGGASVTLEHAVAVADGHILPNTTLRGRWRVIGADGQVAVGPPATVVYADTRFDWQTQAGAIVRVHWYRGDAAFGRRALEIGEQAVEETAALLGVRETEPVDFYVYAEQAAFYDALGPGARENVGGQANAEIRTLFALITPADIDQAWVATVVPHELVHLVFDTAVKNPYHYPLHWLNEGLAVYLSAGYARSDRSSVETAAGNGSLMPLTALGGQFPTSYERFALAYAESVSAVDFLVAEHGREALVALIRSYADGVTDDEAFLAAVGQDVATFDAAWRTSLDASEPVRHGPRPAPTGPVPPDWLGAGGPGGSPGPSSPPGGPDPGPGGDADRPGAGSLIVGAGVGGLVAVVVVGVLLIRRRRRPDEGSGW